MKTMDVMRVFVGGLPRHIEPEELKSRFIKFGKVLDVEVKNKLDATGKHTHASIYIQ